jgi:RNA polymerase sigma-70 factor (ECF subfamily)
MAGCTGMVYNYILCKTPSPDDAEDILRETMLGVWQGIKNFDGASSLKTWIISVARRKIADLYRRKYRRGDTAEPDENEELSSEDEYGPLEDKISVESALSSLRPNERELVFLVFNAQLTYSEISKIMSTPEGTIKTRIRAIKEKLRKKLEVNGT